ncbi:MAG: BrnT family toxin [Gallionella sp.]|nr:BrnT family toxin [Gallionella sp.]
MNITFDPSKDAINIDKHGVSLVDASGFEWDEAVTWQDQRHEYGECRMIGLGYIGIRLFVIVFVDRGENRRIISLRKANPKEVTHYAQT